MSTSDLIAALSKAGEKGLSRTGVGRAAKVTDSKLDAFISELHSEGLLYGPFSIGRAKYYYDKAHAPSRKRAEQSIEIILRGFGLKLTGRKSLNDEVKGTLKSFVADALSSLKSEGKIIEFKSGGAVLYAHCEPILEVLRVPQLVPRREEEGRRLSLADLLPAYNQLKAEQGGVSAVKIYDLAKTSSFDRDDVHRVLREAAREGRVSLHFATTVNFPKEVIDAGISFEGESGPRVTVVFKEGK